MHLFSCGVQTGAPSIAFIVFELNEVKDCVILNNATIGKGCMLDVGNKAKIAYNKYIVIVACKEIVCSFLETVVSSYSSTINMKDSINCCCCCCCCYFYFYRWKGIVV